MLFEVCIMGNSSRSESTGITLVVLIIKKLQYIEEHKHWAKELN